ncbi:MAG TPA: hypothetical protein VM680_03910 [Verrucomicrobiae bacterium]|nr:hypothetical protein [Verrucomicrobiae bacterium]
MKAGSCVTLAHAFVFLFQFFALEIGLSALGGEIGPNTDAFIKSVTNPEGTPFVERNAKGALIGISVWGEYANDETFRELSRVATLERLRFSFNSKSNLLTAAGISALSKAPRLAEVVFQCNREVPDSFYWALGQLRQIGTLRFAATWPNNPLAARPLTNLVGLKQISISYPPDFSARDIEILSQMTSLRDVKIWAQHVDEAALAPLLENTTITNLEVRAWNLKLVRARDAVDVR